MPIVPSNSMKPAFIRIDATTLTRLCCNFTDADNMSTPTCISDIMTLKALHLRRTLAMGTSFLTDGRQIILHFDVVREKIIPVHTLQTLQNSNEFRAYAETYAESSPM